MTLGVSLPRQMEIVPFQKMVGDQEKQQNDKGRNCLFYGEPDKYFHYITSAPSVSKTDMQMVIRVSRQGLNPLYD